MKEFIEKLIGRLEELKTYYAEDFSQGYSCEVDCVEKYEVKKIVNQLAEEYINTSTDTSSGWISVKDRLPTEEGSYLVVGKTGGATVTRWYMPNKFHPQGHFGGNSAEYIRYWMPRPQAPKYEPKENKTMTNADRIRSMTDEELAEFLEKLETVCDMCAYNIGCTNIASDNCKAGLLKWLQSKVEGVTENE